MSNVIMLSQSKLETNSDLWEIVDADGERVLQIVGNRKVDHVSGKIALFDEPRCNYTMSADMRFLGHHLLEGSGGWFGFAVRARDELNYELVWFMPLAEKNGTVAYLSVAHGIVPWWTEAYSTQQKGGPTIPANDWFRARVDVIGDELSIYVENEFVFTKKLTYYLSEGCPGLYVGTATDAAFRRIEIDDLIEDKIHGA
ncbi:MAG: hypothetical protein WBB65_07270 [Anaerolineales bacterium]